MLQFLIQLFCLHEYEYEQDDLFIKLECRKCEKIKFE